MKNTILVVVDKFTKDGHFLTLSHPYSAVHVAQEFLSQVYKLHGVLESIVSDCDRVFINIFWKELFKYMGTKLHLSTAYHPQTNGQTKES